MKLTESIETTCRSLVRMAGIAAGCTLLAGQPLFAASNRPAKPDLLSGADKVNATGALGHT